MTEPREGEQGAPIAITPQERAQLRQYLVTYANERQFSVSSRRWEHDSSADQQRLHLDLERAWLDVKDLEDQQLPITPAKLQEYVRAIEETTRFAFTADQLAALPIFLNQMKRYLRHATTDAGSVATARYTVLLIPEPAAGGYSVQVPILPGCLAQGNSREAALANIREAIQGHLEALAADGQAIPQETAPPELVAVDV